MKFRIWSNEHMAWWRADKRGYSQDISDAGVYSYVEAVAICIQARLHHVSHCVQRPNEAMVPEDVE